MEFSALKKSICRLVHDFYSQNPDPKNILWDMFLKELIKLDSPLEIFTTNYDNIFEVVNTRSTLGIETGEGLDKETRRYSVLNDDIWDTPVSGNGRLTKLHGSVGWKKNNNTIEFVREVDSIFDPDDYGVLYPGFDKNRSKIPPPFNKFYDYLENRLNDTTTVIFVGFSFRDRDITRIIDKVISDIIYTEEPDDYPKAQAFESVVIDLDNKDNPGPPDDMPKVLKENCRYVGQGFSEKTAKDCIAFLQSRILREPTAEELERLRDDT